MTSANVLSTSTAFSKEHKCPPGSLYDKHKFSCPFRLSTDEHRLADLVHRRRDPTPSLEALLVPFHGKQSLEEETAKGAAKLD